MQLDLLPVRLDRLPGEGKLALELGLANLALPGRHAHLLERALHQRLIAAQGGRLLGQLRARRLALAQIRREQVAVEECLLQVAVYARHGPPQLLGGVLFQAQLRGQVLHLTLQGLNRLVATLQHLAQEELG